MVACQPDTSTLIRFIFHDEPNKLLGIDLVAIQIKIYLDLRKKVILLEQLNRVTPNTRV